MHPSNHPHLHFEPYELFWQPTEASKPVKAHGELYTSEAFIEAHCDLQDSPGEPGCDLQRVVVGLMFASDGTQLSAFSTAKLWPIYLAMGNKSKDRRSKPSCQAFEHIAYLETLPDAFKAFATEHLGGKGLNGAFMAHCHREIYNAQWEIILDDEFLEAYEHGIVIMCCNGIWHCFYPHIFTYSADYKENFEIILIASIHNLGRCPCPCCLIPLDCVSNMGMHQDMTQRRTLARIDDVKWCNRVETAHEKIYEQGYVVDSMAVEDLLQEDSLVPTAV
ncbi:hypothetical protein L208DRAFT_1298201 [Tricholoma matsutake]|nr:hypothetical protein L208DRAFT_1298201 [Tricholoma matsutake 945]